MKKIKDINSIKGIDTLRKAFDNVIYEELETHQTLELSNNVKKNNIEKVVYLKLNISFNGNGGRGPKECLEGAINDLLPWLDLLLAHDEKEKQSFQQMSLFSENENSNDIELEDEPESPGSEGNWDKYFKDREKVRIRNLKKQYLFFDLFDPLEWWWTYHYFDYTKFIPSFNEMENLIKEKILKYKDNEGRHHDAWFESVKSITNNKPISDVELYSRVMQRLRVYVAPWNMYSGVMMDDSYSKIMDKRVKNEHLFYFDGNSLNLFYSNLKNAINFKNKKEFGILRDEVVSYDFFAPEFISFLRETFNAEYKEPLDDKEAKKILLKSFAQSVNPSWETILNNSSSYKEFKTKLFNGINPKEISFKHDNLTEDYSFVMNIDGTTPYLRIEQRVITRKRLKYVFDESSDLEYWKYIVDCLEKDEVFKQIFNLFKTTTTRKITQPSLFSFLDVA